MFNWFNFLVFIDICFFLDGNLLLKFIEVLFLNFMILLNLWFLDNSLWLLALDISRQLLKCLKIIDLDCLFQGLCFGFGCFLWSLRSILSFLLCCFLLLFRVSTYCTVTAFGLYFDLKIVCNSLIYWCMLTWFTYMRILFLWWLCKCVNFDYFHTLILLLSLGFFTCPHISVQFGVNRWYFLIFLLWLDVWIGCTGTCRVFSYLLFLLHVWRLLYWLWLVNFS